MIGGESARREAGNQGPVRLIAMHNTLPKGEGGATFGAIIADQTSCIKNSFGFTWREIYRVYFNTVFLSHFCRAVRILVVQ